MLGKVLEDPNLAVSWCINAKNSIHSIHGFSPYQLAIDKNPKLPSALNEKAPASTHQSVSKNVSSNLDARIGQEKPSLPVKTPRKSYVLYPTI